jgi:hypothetical protein
MFRKASSNDDGSEELLGRALRTLPDPLISRDFNTRIHLGLTPAVNVTHGYWRRLRPALCGMGGSFAVTLGLLSMFGGSAPNPGGSDVQKLKTTAAHQVERSDEMDSLIERADLTSASIRTLLLPASPPAPARPPGAEPSSMLKSRTTSLQGA